MAALHKVGSVVLMRFIGNATQLIDWLNFLLIKYGKDAKIVDIQEGFNG